MAARSKRPAIRAAEGRLTALPDVLLAAVYRHLPVRALGRLRAAGRSTQVRAALALLWEQPTGDEDWLDVHAWGVRGPQDAGMVAAGWYLLLLDQNGYMRRSAADLAVLVQPWGSLGLDTINRMSPACRASAGLAGVPREVFPRLPGPRMRQVTALDRRWLMLDVRGGVWSCWPEDGAPVPVEGMPTAVRSLSASLTHCLLLTARGEVFTCGHDLRPERVSCLPPVRQVAAGVAVSFFLDRRGQVWSCGSNQSGQLLRPETVVVFKVPLRVPLPIRSPVVQLAAAAGNVATVHADGTLCCGGRHSVPPAMLFMAVCSTGVASVAVTSQHTVVQKTNGSVWTAGSGPADGKLCTTLQEYSLAHNPDVGYYKVGAPPVQQVLACTLCPGSALTLLRRPSGAELWGGSVRGAAVPV
jgi:hypothetical protein